MKAVVLLSAALLLLLSLCPGPTDADENDCLDDCDRWQIAYDPEVYKGCRTLCFIR